MFSAWPTQLRHRTSIKTAVSDALGDGDAEPIIIALLHLFRTTIGAASITSSIKETSFRVMGGHFSRASEIDIPGVSRGGCGEGGLAWDGLLSSIGIK